MLSSVPCCGVLTCSAAPAALSPHIAPHLQGLHLEDNDLEGGLPLAPYLLGLRELLVDWQTALDSPDALRAAPALTRLILSGHRAVDLLEGGRLRVRRGEAADPLLAALAAMPSLRRVDDVFGLEDVVTAPVASAMWRMGRALPHVQLGEVRDGNVGWSLADVERQEHGGGAVVRQE